MGKWKMVRLGDVFNSIKNGASIKQGENKGAGIPITRIETISDGTINRGKMGYAGITDFTRYSDYILDSGDILMSHINSRKHLGKTALYRKQDGEVIIHGMNLLRLKVDKNRLNSVYANYYFKSYFFKQQLPRITKNSVNQSSFTVTALKELSIPAPPLDMQQKIAAVLDKASALIELRKAQLDKLDLLIKSQFIEMFGDPLLNPRKWDLQRITDVCSLILGGGTPSKSHLEYFRGSIPWVTPKDMKSSVISDSIDHITIKAIKNSTANIIPAHSVLMVIRSGILKHDLPVAINSVPITINQDMKSFVPNERITAIFLMNYFKAIEGDILSGVRGVTADNIDFKAFQKRMVIVPPISLQIKFSAFVKQVEAQKKLLQQSLSKLELNYKSLMQKCFRGEIF